MEEKALQKSISNLKNRNKLEEFSLLIQNYPDGFEIFVSQVFRKT